MRIGAAASTIKREKVPSHLTGAADDGVLRGAEQGVTLGVFGALVDQAGVNTVGRVPEVRVLRQVVPRVAVPSRDKKIRTRSYTFVRFP